MNQALQEYFDSESSYFSPCIQFRDTLMNLKEGLTTSTVNLDGVNSSKEWVLAIFNDCKKAVKTFNETYKTAQHYFVKIRTLDKEKRAKESQGKALDGKSLERISRVGVVY